MTSLSEFSTSLTMKAKWHGNNDENDCRRKLHAGRMSMIYENGSLKYISMGNHEIIRMIYSAVRDKEWLTIEPVISDEEFEIDPFSFSIRYSCRYKSGKIDFSARYCIEGSYDNSLILSFEGEAMDTFEKNRIGFCVLHPIEGFAGETCTITHSNGEKEDLKFPEFISPHQPFTDIWSMHWNTAGNECILDFSGDVFETEDQRNWTDASYKTYCTPLSRPFPVTIKKGEKINQKIELKIEAGLIQKKQVNNQIVVTIHPEKRYDLPMIGIGQSTRPGPLTESEIQILKKLKFDHYRIDLYLFNADWKIKGDIALDESARLGYPVEFSLFLDDDAENQISDYINWIPDSHPEIAVINLFHKTKQSTPDLLTDTISPLLRDLLPGVKTGCGTNSNFAQLNRNRPVSHNNDLICYSIHPQEHASDNTTLVENLKAQEYTVKSAKKFAESKGIWISPVTIQRRFNANIENYEIPGAGDDFPPQVDSRLMSLFGACWTTGSLKYLIESGIKGVTFFETVGERGIIQGDSPPRWPEKFQSVKEMIFPVFHIFHYLLNNKSFKVIRSECSHPLIIDIFALSDGQQAKIILVNFTSDEKKVNFEGRCELNAIQQINSDNFEFAMCDPEWIENAPKRAIRRDEKILLEPFSVSFIDIDL